MHIKYIDKKREYSLDPFERMEIAYNNIEAKKVYQECNIIRKGFKPQTLLLRDTEGNRVNKKKNILQRWSEYDEKDFELQDGDVFVVITWFVTGRHRHTYHFRQVKLFQYLACIRLLVYRD